MPEEFDPLYDVRVRFAFDAEARILEPDDLITSYFGDILRLDETGQETEIGTMRAYKVLFTEAMNDESSAASSSWFDILDCLSQETAEYAALLRTGRRGYRNEYRESLEEASMGGYDLLILSLMAIEPAYRGSGIGLAASYATIQHVGAGCGIVACKPFPTQFEGYVDPAHPLHGQDQAFRAARAKLRAYWGLLGFKPLHAKSELLVLDRSIRQPSLREALTKAGKLNLHAEQAVGAIQ